MNSNISDWYNQHEGEVIELARRLFEHPETGLNEFYACDETAKFLEKEGFDVQRICLCNSEKPNTIIAKWGKGHPAIGMLGEYDALDNLGQKPGVPYQSPVPGPGHGCGHNLINSAAVGAACSLRYAMEKDNLPGTVVFYGCPAEEKLCGKLVMDDLGYFNDLDIALLFHPDAYTAEVCEKILMACGLWKFEFSGRTAHAASQAYLGRSALDAAELMNIGVQFLREHVRDDIRIHYKYTDCNAPLNVVPERATLDYGIRAHRMKDYKDAAERVCKIAQGAAMMTETTVKCTEQVSCCEGKVNHTLNRALYDASRKVPDMVYTEEEIEFARELYHNATGQDPDKRVLLESCAKPPRGVAEHGYGSTDLDRVMWRVPTAWFLCFGVQGIPGHHWSFAAMAGSPVGERGMIYAGKSMAQCGCDIINDPELLQACWEEHNIPSDE